MMLDSKIPQITFRNCDRSGAIEQCICENARWLEKFHHRILGCRVLVEKPHRHHHKGNLYHLRIDISTPGKRIVVARNGVTDPAHEDLHVTVRDAFVAARRRLEDEARAHRNRARAPMVA